MVGHVESVIASGGICKTSFGVIFNCRILIYFDIL